ncbi:MAG: glutathione S-transferase N-terminal domain-containing protein, partial [Polyangiaceae bacterium]
MKSLYVIHHSPWSERARWALLHHELRFVEREHVPLVGELALRRRAKQKGKVSVPLLVEDDGTAIQGSMAIAEHADNRGSRPTLFPPGHESRIRELFDAIEDSLCAGRERFGQRLANDREAQLDVLPPLLRKLPFAGLSAKMGSSFIRKKWDATKGSIDDRIRGGLVKAREAVNGQKYV